MEEIEKVVTSDSTPETQDVNTDATVPVVTEETASSPAPQKTLADQAVEEEVDDKGVSYKNRFKEMQRKYDQVVETIPQIINQTLTEKLSTQNVQQPQQTERKYSVRELEEFAIANPEYRGWVEEEKAKLNVKLAVSEFERLNNEKEKVRQEASTRQESFNKLTSEYSELFTTDSQGRKVWDNSNPIVRQVAILMQNPQLQQDPRGLEYATLMAYGQVAKSGNVSNAKKESKLKAEVKTLQKKTFVEGGQKSQVIAKDEVRDAIDDLKKTGSKKAVSNAVSAYFKKVGYIQ